MKRPRHRELKPPTRLSGVEFLLQVRLCTQPWMRILSDEVMIVSSTRQVRGLGLREAKSFR